MSPWNDVYEAQFCEAGLTFSIVNALTGLREAGDKDGIAGFAFSAIFLSDLDGFGREIPG